MSDQDQETIMRDYDHAGGRFETAVSDLRRTAFRLGGNAALECLALKVRDGIAVSEAIEQTRRELRLRTKGR